MVYSEEQNLYVIGNRPISLSWAIKMPTFDVSNLTACSHEVDYYHLFSTAKVSQAFHFCKLRS